MGGACGMYGGQQRRIQGFGGVTLGKTDAYYILHTLVVVIHRKSRFKYSGSTSLHFKE